MKIKQKPEDFSVKESYRFDEVDEGRYFVYLMDKQKLSTFDAIERIRTRFGLRPGSISYCGLKDKQGRTEQLIAVDGAEVDVQEPDLRTKLLGRTDKPLSAANITSNRFSVTVRSLEERDLVQLNIAAAEVNRLGVVNYFDSQRFGSLKHGQGFIAKDLIRGDFEAALKNYMAKPSELDRSDDAKVKEFWKRSWGDWNKRPPFNEANRKYERILRSLRKDPKDFVQAFLQIDAAYRAMLLFTYQSYLWNEGARRLLQILMKREQLFPLPYQAGTLLLHRDADPETLRYLRELKFPLLGPDSTFDDPKVEEAVKWVLGREKLKLEELRIEEAPNLLFFKHEPRPLLMHPHKLVVGRPGRDEVNRGKTKVNVAFTLPPGAYATLVVKRLFHFTYREDTREDIRESQYGAEIAKEIRERKAGETGRRSPAPARGEGLPRRAAKGDGRAPVPDAATEARHARALPADTGVHRLAAKAKAPAPTADEAPVGFRAKQKQRKEAKQRARAAQPNRRKS